MLCTESLVFDLVAVIVTLLVGIVGYLKWNLGYWERCGVPGLNPVMLYGDASSMLSRQLTAGEQFREFYQKFKAQGAKYGGVILGTRHILVPVDTEVIKNILQRDFAHFVNHGVFSNPKDDPLSGHLFNLEDAAWRNMRVKLTPTFTSGKMKMMFQTLVDCGDGLKGIMNEAAQTGQVLDIKDILARFSTDIIGSCAFGLQCNSLKDPEAKFRQMGRRVFADFQMKGLMRLKAIAHNTLPHAVLRAFGYRSHSKEVEEFFMGAIKDTIAYRERNTVTRKDFLQLLIQLKNQGRVDDDEQASEPLTMNELAAQAFVFFLAGFETSSTTMSFALYEIAKDPNVQARLRDEINRVMAVHKNLTYDAIMEMKYLENVLHETLRKYPPIPVLNRVCTEPYTLPGTQITIQKGTPVYVPVLALHTDPDYYPNPDVFDPDRFLEENKKTRPNFTWLPFGEGPRLCIGLRFGMMQSKVGLVTLLQNYKIKLSHKTQVPLKLDKRSFISSAEGGIWLEVERL